MPRSKWERNSHPDRRDRKPGLARPVGAAGHPETDREWSTGWPCGASASAVTVVVVMVVVDFRHHWFSGHHRSLPHPPRLPFLARSRSAHGRKASWCSQSQKPALRVCSVCTPTHTPSASCLVGPFPVFFSPIFCQRKNFAPKPLVAAVTRVSMSVATNHSQPSL
jgi:hypothetical protein